jgi:glycosyltransferase involved in cell wall biosynthesis
VRIALVVPGGVDASGRERVIPSLLSLIARLAATSESLVYVLRYHPEPRSYSLLGATVHDLGSPRGVRRQYRALMRALRRHGPVDVIHGWWALPSGFVASAVGRRLGIPSVVTCDSGEFVQIPDIAYGSQLHWRQRLAVAATLRLATRVTVCSRYQAELASACGARAEIVPIGVDKSLFVPAARVEGPPWRLLHVASLNRVKDQPTLLAGFQRLIDRGIDAHLDIVGEDTLNGAIQDLAGTLGIGARVTFHGFLCSEELVPLYQRAHLLVVSSRHEAAGVVVLEAAACSTPVVGTRVGYLADWTPDNAVTVPPRDAPALAAAVADLLCDRSKRDGIAKSAREWALAHDADWTAQQFERIYREASLAVARDPRRQGRQR